MRGPWLATFLLLVIAGCAGNAGVVEHVDGGGPLAWSDDGSSATIGQEMQDGMSSVAFGAIVLRNTGAQDAVVTAITTADQTNSGCTPELSFFITPDGVTESLIGSIDGSELASYPNVIAFDGEASVSPGGSIEVVALIADPDGLCVAGDISTFDQLTAEYRSDGVSYRGKFEVGYEVTWDSEAG